MHSSFTETVQGSTDGASTRLVPVRLGPTASTAAGSAARPSAAFLAQLIATAQQCPQTRERRRAEPSHAVHCYTAIRDDKPQAAASLRQSL